MTLQDLSNNIGIKEQPVESSECSPNQARDTLTPINDYKRRIDDQTPSVKFDPSPSPNKYGNGVGIPLDRFDSMSKMSENVNPSAMSFRSKSLSKIGGIYGSHHKKGPLSVVSQRQRMRSSY